MANWSQEMVLWYQFVPYTTVPYCHIWLYKKLYSFTYYNFRIPRSLRVLCSTYDATSPSVWGQWSRLPLCWISRGHGGWHSKPQVHWGRTVQRQPLWDLGGLGQGGRWTGKTLYSWCKLTPKTCRDVVLQLPLTTFKPGTFFLRNILTLNFTHLDFLDKKESYHVSFVSLSIRPVVPGCTGCAMARQIS